MLECMSPVMIHCHFGCSRAESKDMAAAGGETASMAGKPGMPAEQPSMEQQIQQLSPTDPIADWIRHQSAFLGRGQPGYNGGNRGSSLPFNLPVSLPVSVPVSPPVSLPFGSFASLPVLAGLSAPEQSARDDELFSASRLSGGSLGGGCILTSE